MIKAPDQNTKDTDSQLAERVIADDEKALESSSYSEIESKMTVDGIDHQHGTEITPSSIVHKNQTAGEVASQICGGHPLIVRPSWTSLLPIIIGSLLFTFVVFYLSALVFSDGESVPLNAAFIPLCLLMVIVHKRYNSKYMITPEGLFVIRGMLGVEAKRVRIPYSKVREFEIRKHILHRILFLNDSDIYISTMLFDEPEIRMAGFSNAAFYVVVMRELMRKIVGDPDTPGNVAETALAP